MSTFVSFLLAPRSLSLAFFYFFFCFDFVESTLLQVCSFGGVGLEREEKRNETKRERIEERRSERRGGVLVELTKRERRYGCEAREAMYWW